MNDLYRLIVNMDSFAREGLAEFWQVELAISEPIPQAQAIGDAMCRPGALLGVVAEQSQEAQLLLARIIRQGGSEPLQRLQALGSIRKLGSARMMREQPWFFPEGPLEELVYKGLVFSIYQNTGDRVTEQLVIPDQLLQQLKEGLSAHESTSPVTDAPLQASSCGQTFSEDVMAVLVSVRQHMPHASSRKSAAAAIDNELGRLQKRLIGLQTPGRLQLLRHILLDLGFVQPEHGRLLPGSRARAWLHRSDAERTAALLDAWRAARTWRELALVKEIECDRNSLQHDPRPAREVLLEYLAGLPAAQWISTTNLLARIKVERPDLLRPDGDLQSWHVHDAKTGELLAGFSHWDRVEGAAIQMMLQGPLWWLGIVELGDEGASFRLTSSGSAALSGELPGPTPVPPVAATLDGSFRVHMPTVETLYDRYQLERFARWESQTDRTAVLRITAESVWEGQNADVPIDGIQRFLERITTGNIPDIVRQTLQAWGGRFGRVLVRRVILLETDDKETMRTLQDWPDITLLLEQTISPTMCLVREANLTELTARLKEHGIWPHIRVEPA